MTPHPIYGLVFLFALFLSAGLIIETLQRRRVSRFVDRLRSNLRWRTRRHQREYRKQMWSMLTRRAYDKEIYLNNEVVLHGLVGPRVLIDHHDDLQDSVALGLYLPVSLITGHNTQRRDL